MTDQSHLASTARAIIDSNRYMTLAKADASGRPWASPVYYAADGYERFLWVSSPDVVHSRNLADRPDLAIVIFDCRAAIGAGQVVYIEAAHDRRRVGRSSRQLGSVACETGGNYPLWLPGRHLDLLGRVPGGLPLALPAMPSGRYGGCR